MTGIGRRGRIRGCALSLTMLFAVISLTLTLAACGDDAATPTAVPPTATTTPTAVPPTATATEAPATPTATATGTPATPTATETPTPTATPPEDVRSQFPADVQPLLADLPDNLVQLLLDVRNQGPDTLVWADAGGELHEGMRRAFLAEWEQITGWTVENSASGVAAPVDFEAKVKAGDVPWDVVELGNGETYARLDLLDPLDLTYFPIDRYPQGSPYSDNWIDLADGMVVLTWNTEVFPLDGEHPDSVLDIFDTTTFPGKRCVFSFYEFAGALEFALLADGVPSDEVYTTLATDEGVQQALAKLDTIKDDIIFIDSGAESIQFPLDGQCDMGITWNGRPGIRKKDEPDLPIAMTRKDSQLYADAFAIAKGAKHHDAALSAMAYAAQPQSQCDFMNNIGYGVVIDSSCLDDYARDWGVNPDEAGVVYDPAFFLDNNARLSELWSAWVAAD